MNQETAPSLCENGEPLVPTSLCPEKVLVRPQYFIQGLPGTCPEIFLRREVYRRLVRATDSLPPGWKLVLLDGWRSPELQAELFRRLKMEISQSEPMLSSDEVNRQTLIFVDAPSAEPETVSGHATGGAVDLTVVDDSGFLLDMGTQFDETSKRSATAYYDDRVKIGNHAVMENRRILLNIMVHQGFTNYPEEWWHFDYGNRNWAIQTGTERYPYGPTSPEFRWT